MTGCVVESSLPRVVRHALHHGAFVNNSRLSDVQFTVGDEVLFGHSFVLASQCQWFETLLYGPMDDSSRAQRRYTIEGFHPDEAKRLFHYLYTGEFPVETLLQAAKGYRLADYFGLEALKEECLGTLNAQGVDDMGSALVVLEYALEMSLDALLRPVEEYVMLHAMEFLTDETVLKDQKETTMRYIAEHLIFDNEELLAEAILLWAPDHEAACRVLRCLHLELLAPDFIIRRFIREPGVLPDAMVVEMLRESDAVRQIHGPTCRTELRLSGFAEFWSNPLDVNPRGCGRLRPAKGTVNRFDVQSLPVVHFLPTRGDIVPCVLLPSEPSWSPDGPWTMEWDMEVAVPKKHTSILCLEGTRDWMQAKFWVFLSTGKLAFVLNSVDTRQKEGWKNVTPLDVSPGTSFKVELIYRNGSLIAYVNTQYYSTYPFDPSCLRPDRALLVGCMNPNGTGEDCRVDCSYTFRGSIRNFRIRMWDIRDSSVVPPAVSPLDLDE